MLILPYFTMHTMTNKAFLEKKNTFSPFHLVVASSGFFQTKKHERTFANFRIVKLDWFDLSLLHLLSNRHYCTLIYNDLYTLFVSIYLNMYVCIYIYTHILKYIYIYMHMYYHDPQVHTDTISSGSPMKQLESVSCRNVQYLIAKLKEKL